MTHPTDIKRASGHTRGVKLAVVLLSPAARATPGKLRELIPDGLPSGRPVRQFR